jgi:hypothetical protein
MRDIVSSGHVMAGGSIIISVSAAREAGINAAGLANSVDSAARLQQVIMDVVNRSENAFREGDTE